MASNGTEIGVQKIWETGSRSVGPEERTALGTRAAILLRVGRALHAFGASSSRIEGALTQLAAKLGIQAHFFVTPTSLFTSFGEAGDEGVSMLRVSPQDVDLEKLTQLYDLVGQILRDEIPADDAILERLSELMHRPARWGSLLTTIAFMAASAGAARFFGGAWGEMAVAAASGVCLGALAALSRRSAVAGRLFMVGSAFLISLLARLAGLVDPGISPYIATVAGLIVLVPGFTLTTAMSELANGHLASGSTRLSGAAVVFLVLGFGVALGTGLGSAIVTSSVAIPARSLAPWTLWLSLALTPVAFTVLFRAHPRQLGWILIGGWIAYLSSRYGSQWAGPEMGAALGALLVGLYANLVSRWRDIPASVPLVPSIMLLVPGSLGFRAVSLLMAEDYTVGGSAAFTALLVAVALAVGLLVANSALPPRREL